jgi:hypothetical protein
VKDIKTIIKEELNNFLHEYQEVLGIPQLAQVIAQLNGENGIDGPYYEVALNTLAKAFRYGGDEEVQKEFKINTNKDLNVISKGKYIII